MTNRHDFPEFIPTTAMITNTLTAQCINKLNLGKCGIVIDLETGEVTIPEGLALTDAAREFWNAVEHISGYRRPGFW